VFQLPAVSPKKLPDFLPRVRYPSKCRVDFIHEQNNFHGRIGRRCSTLYGVKREDLRRLFVVEKREVLLLEPRDRLSGFIGHGHIQSDEAIRTGRRGWWRLGKSPKGGQA
jgi:hypothetical protein